MHSRISSILSRVLLVVMMMVSCAVAHEEKPEAKPDETKSETKSAVEQFAASKADWEKVQKEIRGVVQEYQTASDDKREEIRKKYIELVAQANKTLENVRSTGIAAYTEAPNKDEKVITTLVGLIANDVNRDDYAAAIKLAQLLIDNKAEHSLLYSYAGTAAYGSDQFAQANKWLRQAAENGLVHSRRRRKPWTTRRPPRNDSRRNRSFAKRKPRPMISRA